MKRLVLILMMTLAVTTAAMAAWPAPQAGTMPFYWIDGDIIDAGNQLAGRPVVLYAKTFDSTLAVTAEVVNGHFRVNAYELYFYHKDDNYIETAGKPTFILAVVRDWGGVSNNYGTQEIAVADWNKGYLRIDLEIVEGGGPRVGYGQVAGVVSNETGAAVADAQITVNRVLSATSDATGAYATGDIAPVNSAIVTCSAATYGPVSALANIEANKVAWVNFRLGEAVPAGTVPLTITRDGNNVRVSWDYVTYPNPQVFYMTGAGVGAFTNNYDANIWKPTAGANGFTEHMADGYILHNNQVGAASTDKEVYYKALQNGISDIAGVLPTAWAVGKVDVSVDISSGPNGGMKLVGLPLQAGKVSDAFLGQLGSKTVTLLPRSGSGLDYVTATNNSVTGADFIVDPGIGFWIRNPNADALQLTFTGRLLHSLKTVDLVQFDLTGNPIATSIPSDLIGADGDIILPQAGSGLDYTAKTGGHWGTNFPTLSLNQGFWYKYSAGSRRWTVDPAPPSAVLQQY